MIRLNEFKLPSCGVPVNRSVEPVRVFKLPTTLWHVLKRLLHMKPRKLQIVQQSKVTDETAYGDFSIAMQEKLGDDGFDDISIRSRI